ncbi:MAG: hypothetical protein NVV73_07330 [Cellvibrionaceae bacterium]|nr:hypothetical protein [Cellvibrionaceae bacterium]
MVDGEGIPLGGTITSASPAEVFNDPSRFMLIVNTSNNFDAVEISQGAVVGR